MASDKLTPRIVELANIISLSTAEIQKTLDDQGAPSLSFDENASLLPKDIAEAQSIVLDATAELHDLLVDPLDHVQRLARGDTSSCLQTIAHFGIASLVPLNGRTSFAELAKKTPLTEQMVGRIIRHAVTMRIFREPEPGIVMHTSVSKMLASPEMDTWTLAGTMELNPASGKLPNALEKWPGSQEPNETGYALANDSKGFYDVLMTSPERAGRFATAMKVMMSRPQFNVAYGTDSYDWTSLGEAQIVDIGGSQGHFAMALVKRHSNLRVVVQDMAMIVEHADAGDLADRVRFEAHDLFSPQTVHADVFHFRWIFHNWSDQYCIAIIKAQIPALKPGARVIVQERLMPKPGGVPLWQERDLRSMDLEMACFLNARERTLEDWERLFREADPAFVLKNVIEPKGSAMGILEIVWEGIDASAK